MRQFYESSTILDSNFKSGQRKRNKNLLPVRSRVKLNNFATACDVLSSMAETPRRDRIWILEWLIH